MTPLSAVFSALLLALFLLLVAPLTAYLPIAAMGGIILLVAYHLIDVYHINAILKTSTEESAVMVVTFLATLFLELEFAIYAGVLISLILYLNRTAHPRIVNLAPDPDAMDSQLIESERECPKLKIIRIDGPLFFGSVNHVSEYLHNIDKRQTHKRNVLIVGSGINLIDIAGAQMLSNEAHRRRSQRGNLYLCDLMPHAHRMLERGRYLDVIGNDHLFTTVDKAVDSIMLHINKATCQNCGSPLFKQCILSMDRR